MDTGTDAPSPTAKTPQLSVVIAAYNAADTLGEQLRALTDDPPAFEWEILVCDNGSTDATAAVVGEWQKRFPSLRLIDASARRGPAAARNIGGAAAASPLLAFCDADDRVGRGWVRTMRAALAEHDFVAGSFEFTELNEGIDAPGLWTAQSTGLTRKSYFPEFVVAGAGNMGIRKAAFEQVGGFYEGLRTAEDDDLCLRVQLSGHELIFVPALLLHVRRRGGVIDLCRQAYAYAAGERRLSYRYAEYAQMNRAPIVDPAEVASTPTPASSTEVETPSPFGRPRRAGELLARAVRKLVTVRRPADLAAIGWRWSWMLGWKLTREDPAIPHVDPADARTLRAGNAT